MKQFYSITRRFQFCAGHRVFNHESKCAHPHGHNYVLLATFKPSLGHGLDELGRVIDFSVIKKVLGDWIEEKIDHGFLFYDKDSDMRFIFKQGDFKHYEMRDNPTAENIAAHILNDICPKLFLCHNVKCTEITLWETENCYATVRKTA